jgi:hypothetical protein
MEVEQNQIRHRSQEGRQAQGQQGDAGEVFGEGVGLPTLDNMKLSDRMTTYVGRFETVNIRPVDWQDKVCDNHIPLSIHNAVTGIGGYCASHRSFNE